VGRVAAAEASVTLELNRGSDTPLHHQLYEGLREAILAGRFAGCTKLPSTRALASELGLSRNTVADAFRQLSAEGYLEGKVGSGTYVCESLPEGLLDARPGEAAVETRVGHDTRSLSRRGRLLADTRTSTVRDAGSEARAFRPGVPALEEFPARTWRRLESEIWRHPLQRLLGYGEPAGYRPLRRVISEYLGATRGLSCEPDQVIVVSGSQQALDLCARLLLDPGDAAWIEDPCYAGARAALSAGGACLSPVPVDEEGIDIDAGEERAQEARLAYVTPSHQYPSGVTMSVGRRLSLLRWAGRAGSWILEDDYDGEFRYWGRPLQALQGLDTDGRVIYLGTFSKVLFPALRLGYLVVPPDLVDAFKAARELTDRHPPTVEQAVLAEFISGGHFARHVRKMRTLYAERQQALVAAASRELSGFVDVEPYGAGMHLVGRLPKDTDDAVASQLAAGKGVEAPSLSAHCIETTLSPRLLLGYAAFEEQTIEAGARRLAEALE
jgi:GntR family transcriptional regulator/MocR family aminotransferase